MRQNPWLSVVWLAACAALVAAAAAAQPDSLDVAPYGSSTVCPSIDENYMLCTGDLYSGNCADFVTAAGELATLYGSQLAQQPDSKASLATTIWWGCGSAHLSDIKALLARIGTPPAKALLEAEPYRSLPEPHPKASKPPGPIVIDCANVAAPKRSECTAQELASAEATHKRAFEGCQAAVAPPLRGQLVAAEKAWNASKGLECGGDSYARSLCLAEATRQRTKGMLAAHPECAGSR